MSWYTIGKCHREDKPTIEPNSESLTDVYEYEPIKRILSSLNKWLDNYDRVISVDDLPIPRLLTSFPLLAKRNYCEIFGIKDSLAECKYCEGTGIRDFGFYTRTCECKLQQSES